LAGVIVGGALGLVTALGLELLRAFRESRFRHVAEKREAYASLLRTAERVIDDARDDMEAIANGQIPTNPEREDYYLAFERLELIGAIPAVDAMRRMHNAVLAVKLFGTNTYARPTDEGWLEALEEYWRRREAFVQAARRDLGVEVRGPIARSRETRRRFLRRIRLPRVRGSARRRRDEDAETAA
jgi:hypothetical protein